MELDTDVVRVVLVRQLNDLHTLALVVLSNKVQSLLGQAVDVLRVNLITVTMALENLLLTTVKSAELGPFATRLEVGRTHSQAHSTTEMGLATFWHEDNDGVGGRIVDLNGVGVLKTKNVAGVFNNGNLHSQADTKVGGLLSTGPFGSSNHTLSSALTEATGDENTVGSANIMPGLVELGGVSTVHRRLESLGLNPDEVELAVTVHGGMLERLDDGEVGVMKIGVLADKGNGDGLETAVLGKGEGPPFLPSSGAALAVLGGNIDLVEGEVFGKDADKSLGLKENGNVVGGVDVVDGDNLLLSDIAEESNLFGSRGVQRLSATASNLFHPIPSVLRSP